MSSPWSCGFFMPRTSFLFSLSDRLTPLQTVLLLAFANRSARCHRYKYACTVPHLSPPPAPYAAQALLARSRSLGIAASQELRSDAPLGHSGPALYTASSGEQRILDASPDGSEVSVIRSLVCTTRSTYSVAYGPHRRRVYKYWLHMYDHKGGTRSASAMRDRNTIRGGYALRSVAVINVGVAIRNRGV